MLKVAWRSVRAHIRQFLLTTFAIVLGVAFLSGTLALRAALSDTFANLTASTFTADLYLTGQKVDGLSSSATIATKPIDAELAQQAEGIDGVAVAHPVALAPGVLVGADNTPVTFGGAPTQFIPLFADEPGLKWVTGRPPSGNQEIALESGALKRSGLKVGGTTHVVLQGEPTKVTVVGEFNYGTSAAAVTLIGVDPQWLMPLAAPQGQVSFISVGLSPGSDANSVKQALTQTLPKEVRVQTRTERIAETNAYIEQILGFIQTFLLVFVVLAMFVGSFIIMNSFAMSVRQRVKEFALLRAVGASPTAVFAVVFLQALVIAAVGSALGIAAGIGLLRALVALLEAADMPQVNGVPMTPGIITASLAVGLVVTVIGALLPAREAALTHPVEAMREVSGVREKSLLVRALSGGLLLAAGAGALAAVWLSPELEQRLLILGLGAVGTLVGLLVISPALARPVVAIIGLPVRLLRPSGRLALRNIIHNPRRTANTSGALMVGMALVCAGATLAASVNASISGEINTALQADLLIQPATQSPTARLSPEIAQKLSQLDGVATSNRFTAITASATRPDGAPVPSAQINVIEPAAYAAAYDLDLRAGSLADLDATHVAAARDSGLSLGDVVTLTGPNGSLTVTVAALIDPPGIRAQFYATAQTAAAVGSWSAAVPTEPAQVLDKPLGMFLTLERDADLAAVQKEAQDLLTPTYQYAAYNAEQLSDLVGQNVNRVLAILYGLLGLSITIAILGIVNTLVLSVAERTREIGLMRAVGLGRTQLAGQIMVESILIALYGTIVGGVAGTVLAAALRKVLADDGLSTLSIPWGQMLAMLILSVLVGVIAALWPSLRAARIPVLDAIATE